MVRMIIGIIAGFLVWSILWLGSDQILRNLWRLYFAHETARENAIFNETAFTADVSVFVVHLARSIIISLMSGFLAAFVANENRKTPFILGILLLLFGLMVQTMTWSYAPVWYHVAFLALLLPVTMLGGKLKKSAAVIP